MSVEQYNLVAHDWMNLEFIINDLASRVVGQELGTGSSPTFVGLALTGLTASKLVATDASKALESVTIGSSLSYAGSTLDTIQDIRTTATPGFNQVVLGTDPTIDSHAVSKAYATALVAGAFWEDVAVGTVANVVLASELEAGDTVDDYVLIEGDRVLVKEQTDQTENGLYVVPASGAASRASDADTAVEIQGKKCIPLNGSLTKHRFYFCITGNITLGVTDIKFAEVTMMTAHNTLSGLQGGQADQYYHLTSAEHTAVGDLASNYQPLDAELTSLAALSYVSASFVKMTGANAFALRTIADTKSDLSLNLVENTAHSTDAHTMTIDGRDVSVDGSKLDGIEALADVTVTNETSHANVVVDGDFGSAGLMNTDGAGTYSIKAIGTDVQAYHANLTSVSGLTYAAAAFVKMTGANTFALRTIGETADDLEGTIDHDSLANTHNLTTDIDHDSITNNHNLTTDIDHDSITNGGAHNYAYITGNDGATNVSAAELEELTDGSETTLHSHAGGGGTGFGRPLILTPQSGMPPATSFATLDTITGGSTPAEVITVLDFDADSSEYMDFKFALPSGYSSNGLDITIYYSMTSDHDEGTPHKVRWECAIRRINDDAEDINGAHAYQYNSISDIVPSEVGEISMAHILFSDGADMDSLAVSEMAILRIYRDHDHADDNATGDAELQMITIKENV